MSREREAALREAGLQRVDRRRGAAVEERRAVVGVEQVRGDRALVAHVVEVDQLGHSDEDKRADRATASEATASIGSYCLRAVRAREDDARGVVAARADLRAQGEKRLDRDHRRDDALRRDLHRPDERVERLELDRAASPAASPTTIWNAGSRTSPGRARIGSSHCTSRSSCPPSGATSVPLMRARAPSRGSRRPRSGCPSRASRSSSTARDPCSAGRSARSRRGARS